MRKEVRGWKPQLRPDKDLYDIANMFNRKIQGWINYYTHFYKSEIYDMLRYINGCLVKWMRRKYKKPALMVCRWQRFGYRARCRT
ncbi:group II intron maturase-specific domain-containing protein [Enterocloster clostridioformis]|uniref:group II intron maturase-specific domain-containing protein n=1 Tax=Enterocloster clostridioformis TaxID=1531 RepID=UPI0036F44476